MPVRSIKNQYRGINAHLHSLYQAEGGWGGFHTVHIGDLAKALNARLRLMGYVARVEESLQIRRIGDVPKLPRADLLVYDLDPSRLRQPAMTGGSQAQKIPVRELFPEEELSEVPYRALAVYAIEPVTRRRGNPVVWIELLSPTNKGIGEDADTYRGKRRNLLRNGMVFVEIDYLHETLPTISGIDPYHPVRGRPFEPAAKPYHIVVIDPRPELYDGEAEVGSVYVDETLPSMTIPLNAGDSLLFDFDAPYQETFAGNFLGDEIDVDYSELPLNFERYNPDDQRRIATRMVAVLEAARDGVDLESGPFAVNDDLTLEDALTQIAALKEGT